MVAIGNAFMVIGCIGILLGSVWILRNYLAGITLMLSVVALGLSQTYSVGLEVVWSLVVITALLLLVGMALRGANT